MSKEPNRRCGPAIPGKAGISSSLVTLVWASATLGVLACGSDDAVTAPSVAVDQAAAAARAAYTAVDLGGPGGASTAFAINPAGQVVGQNQGPPSFQSHAALWVNGLSRDLGTLGGPSSSATAINTVGQVVGLSSLGPGALGQGSKSRPCPATA
jgi:probable HAF family extracellular repeat protein